MKEDNNSMHRTRHLILIIVSVLVMTMMGLTCYAGNSQAQRPPFDPKRFEAELEQYITTHASLTPQEASKFFPVYRQMMKKMRSCFDEMRRYHFVNPADENGCVEAIRRQDELDIEMKLVQQEYHNGLCISCLPARCLRSSRQKRSSIVRRFREPDSGAKIPLSM